MSYTLSANVPASEMDALFTLIRLPFFLIGIFLATWWMVICGVIAIPVILILHPLVFVFCIPFVVLWSALSNDTHLWERWSKEKIQGWQKLIEDMLNTPFKTYRGLFRWLIGETPPAPGMASTTNSTADTDAGPMATGLAILVGLLVLLLFTVTTIKLCFKYEARSDEQGETRRHIEYVDARPPPFSALAGSEDTNVEYFPAYPPKKSRDATNSNVPPIRDQLTDTLISDPQESTDSALISQFAKSFDGAADIVNEGYRHSVSSETASWSMRGRKFQARDALLRSVQLCKPTRRIVKDALPSPDIALLHLRPKSILGGSGDTLVVQIAEFPNHRLDIRAKMIVRLDDPKSASLIQNTVNLNFKEFRSAYDTQLKGISSE
ncbi:MAG: hypothetical protein C5B50_01975 [Verrucomicrobia bacterium]|nr:MAG: hypothetical protein C5B50_01975 [Verrucomicrobiota bacterium]